MTTPQVWHAMANSAYPPSEKYPEADKLEKDIALQMAMGVPLAEVPEAFEDEYELDGEWEAVRGDEPKPADLQAVIDAVAAEYRKVITEPSQDALRLERFDEELAERGIAFSFNEGFDRQEAAECGAELAEELGFNGYAYCHSQDVARLVTSGQLFIGFYSLDLDEDAALEVGKQVVDALTVAGFSPEWDGSLDQRVVLRDLRWEVPLIED